MTKNSRIYNIGQPGLVTMAINDRGDVFFIGNTGAFCWPSGVGVGDIVRLQGVDGDFRSALPGGLNQSGIVPGGSTVSPGITRACEWHMSSATPTLVPAELPSADDFQFASQINDHGDLALGDAKQTAGGYSSDSYLLPGGETVAINGVPGFRDTLPNDLDNKCEVVGNLFAGTIGLGTDPHRDHAFYWSNGKTIDLGTLGRDCSEANGINNRSQVVGTAYDIQVNGSGYQMVDSIAFLWEHGTIIDPNSLLPPGANWLLSSADQINDHGQIVGYGIYNKDEGHAFVMTPR